MPAKTLYALADRFRREALWKRLSDDMLFAIPLPEGTIGYCCVMGMLGEHFSLAVYAGETGLASYRDIVEGVTSPFSERLFFQECVAVSYEAKQDLPPYSRSEIDGYGLAFRGKRAYPCMQSLKPGRYPWRVESPADEEVLALALRAGLEVSRRLGNGKHQQVDLLAGPGDGGSAASLGFSEGPPYGRSIPLIAENADGSFTWSMTPLPEPVAPVYPAPVLTDDLLGARLKKTKRLGVWSCVWTSLSLWPKERRARMAALTTRRARRIFLKCSSR